MHLQLATLAKPMLRCGHIALQHNAQADTNGSTSPKCHVDGDLGTAPVPSPRLGAAALLSLAAIQGDWPMIERVFLQPA